MTTDGAYTYAWDARKLLQSAGGVTYTYDGDGKRVKKSSGKLYWNAVDGTPLAETDTSGTTLNEYIFFGGARIARRDGSGNVYYYFQDHLGTSKTITTSAGVTCYDADFYPFGGERVYTNNCAQNYKFTGLERDTETGNDHALYRMYDSSLGRWLTPDIKGGNLVNPQSWNRYAYVLDNPCSLTDPLGLDPCNFNVAISDQSGRNLNQNAIVAVINQIYLAGTSNSVGITATTPGDPAAYFLIFNNNGRSGGPGGYTYQISSFPVNKISNLGEVYANLTPSDLILGVEGAHEIGHGLLQEFDRTGGPPTLMSIGGNKDYRTGALTNSPNFPAGLGFKPTEVTKLQKACANWQSKVNGGGVGGVGAEGGLDFDMFASNAEDQETGDDPPGAGDQGTTNYGTATSTIVGLDFNVYDSYNCP